MSELAYWLSYLQEEGKPVTVAFTGHRPSKLTKEQILETKEWLKSSIFVPLSSLVSKWVCGGAMGVDTYAAELVMDFGGYLHLELPFQEMEKRWDYDDRARIRKHRSYARAHGCLVDSTPSYYGPKTYFDRDMRMVDQCNILVAVLDDGKRSGTKITVDYATSKNAKSDEHLIKRYNPVTKEKSEFFVYA